MADVLSRTPPSLAFSMASPQLTAPIEINEPPFVDAPEQPIPIPPSSEHDAPLRNPFPWATEPTDRLTAPEVGDSHSGGSHRKHKSLALPEFSFNPASASDAGTHNLSPPTSPKTSSAHSSPSKRHGHRRVRTEFAGGDSRHQSPIVSAVAPIDKLNEEFAKRDAAETLTPSVARAPSAGKKGHKHRRSAAISKDLGSMVIRPTSSGIDKGFPASSPTFGNPLLHAGNESSRTSKSSSPVRVSFAEEVAIIPRRSLPTLQNPGIAPVLRPTRSSDGAETPHDLLAPEGEAATMEVSFSPTEDFSGEPQASLGTSFDIRSEESLGDFPSVSIVEHANEELLPFIDDSAPVLSENFDEDPTATVEIAHHRALPQPASPRSPVITSEPVKDSDNVIDLDSANDIAEGAVLTAEDLRNLRAKSFSAARRSMHSGGMEAPTMRPGSAVHRRTESAPTGTNPFFDRPALPRLASDAADSASEKGFQMENVFEEDEEEVRAAEEEEARSRLQSRNESVQQPFGLGIESPLIDGTTFEDPQIKRSSVVLRDDSDGHNTPTPTNEVDIPSRQHTIRRPSSNRQSLVLASAPEDDTETPSDALQPPLLSDEPFDSRANSFDLGPRPNSQPLPNMTAPPWLQQQDASSYGSTPHEPSQSSAWSTPKLDTAATSMSDAPQLNLPPGDGYTASNVSTDGIPSLISSNSTMSGMHRYTGSNASPSTPSGTQSRNSNMSMASQAERRRKRSSIASLSQLMSMSRSSAGKSNLSVEPDLRCQTSSGLSNMDSVETPTTPGKEKRMKRLSRALKFWKPKDELSQG